MPLAHSSSNTFHLIVPLKKSIVDMNVKASRGVLYPAVWNNPT